MANSEWLRYTPFFWPAFCTGYFAVPVHDAHAQDVEGMFRVIVSMGGGLGTA